MMDNTFGFCDRTENFVCGGKTTSYFYMGFIEERIPLIELFKKDKGLSDTLFQESYFNRNNPEYKSVGEICEECDFCEECNEKHKDILLREDCEWFPGITNQIVQYLFFYSEQLHSAIVFRFFADSFRGHLGYENVADIICDFDDLLNTTWRSERKGLDCYEQKKINKSIRKAFESKNTLNIVSYWESDIVDEYVECVSESIENTTITNLFDIVKLTQ